MDIPDLIAILAKDNSVTAWLAKHSEAYLAHFFFDQDVYHAGYYDPNTEQMTTFFIEQEQVTHSEESEVFKEPGKTILSLDHTKITVAPQQALTLAKKVQEEQYPSEMVFKSIVILQHLDVGQVYNITLVTQAMKTINIKISAEDGTTIKHHIDSLMDMARMD